MSAQGTFEPPRFARRGSRYASPFEVVHETLVICADSDFLEANPKARAQDLRDAFADPEVAGILLGRPCGQLNPSTFVEYDDVVQQVVSREQGLSNLLIVTQMVFGHTEPMMTLPYDALAEIHCEERAFRVMEPGVTD